MPKCVSKRPKRSNGKGTVYLRGSIWYVGYFAPDGKRKRESSGSNIKAVAENLLFERTKIRLMRDQKSKYEMIKAQIATLDNSIELAEREKRKIRLEDAFDTYFKRGGSLNIVDSTREKYRRTFDLLVEYFKDKVSFLDEIREEDAEVFLDTLSKRFCPEAYNVHLGFLKLMFKKFKLPEPFGEQGYLDVPKSTREPFTIDEINRIYAHLKEHRSDQFVMFWHLLCCTGQRKSDIANLKWSSIDLSRRIITLMPRKTIRKKRIVEIPIFDPLYNALVVFPHYESEQHYVLPDIQHRFEHKTLKSAMKVVYNRCGIQTNFRDETGKWHSYKTTHCTRHFFVSLCANSGIPLDVVGRMTGHSSEVIKEYFHSDVEMCRSKMANIDFFSKGIASGKAREDDSVAILEPAMQAMPNVELSTWV